MSNYLEREPNQLPTPMILLVAGSITNLLHWWSILGTLSPLFGYYPEPTKCWLIVKPRIKDIALKTFDDKRYLGAVIGSIEYRENYVT